MPAEKNPADRRRFRRLQTRAPLYGHGGSGTDGLEGMVMNMSDGGLSFETAKALTVGKHVELEITPPEAALPMAKLRVAGQVRWCSPSQHRDGHYWIGVMFAPASPEQSEMVLKFVNDWTLPTG